MQHSRFFTFLLLSLAIVAPGCSKQKNARRMVAAYHERKEEIAFRAHKLDAKESKRLFEKNLLSYGYQPITINIFNNSDDALILRASSFNVPLERCADVAHASRIPTLAIIAAPAYCAGLFFWPALIPVAGLGFWLASRNQAVGEKISARILEGDESVEILPYERLARTIIVKTEYLPREFSCHLFNIHKKSFVHFSIEFEHQVNGCE